jgi:hypothetical protein
MAQDRYSSSFDGVYNARTGELVPSRIDTKAKTPTYRHAQKEAMQRGDSGTYFMRKTGGRKKKSRGGGR